VAGFGAVKLDVTSPADVEKAVATAVETFGRIDVLFNNAGCGFHAAKFAVEGLSEALALEAKPLGLKVTIVEPGGFRTDWAGASMKAIGIDLAVLLHKSGLSLTLWTTGQGMVTTEQHFRMWRTVRDLYEDPAIGLKLPGLIQDPRFGS
jgi:NAD(P)-dependent dehydrogenase (short-subunit alcohol dehydrogenase family)